MRYVVKTAFRMGGRSVRRGEMIELDERRASFRLGCGYIEPAPTAPQKKLVDLKVLQKQQAIADAQGAVAAAQAELDEATTAAAAAREAAQEAAEGLKEIEDAAAEAAKVAKVAKGKPSKENEKAAQEAAVMAADLKKNADELNEAAKEALNDAQLKEKALAVATAALAKASK